MITYVNSKDAKLFELAAADLGVESLDLDQYLNRLAELKAISPRYVRLPLYEDGHEDEEIFVINANERTIKVPSTFSKNGVGVVSDELAETIWFKINRYFDIKDFGKAAGVVGDELKDGNLHILIQWEAPDGAQGASWAYAIDDTTDPEFIYFGWALTAEHLTAKAGNIKFGIRILQYDRDEIAYSFATQAAQITVKPGLSFDVTDEGIEIESVADKMASRLMNGAIAHCPVFEAPDPEDDSDIYGGNLPPYVLNLTGDPAQDKLEVVATAPEGEEYDAIAYKWYKKGPDDEDFVLIPDENENGQFTPSLAITSSGQYYVVVFGMKEIVDNYEVIFEDGAKVPDSKFKYHASVASSKSTVCEIPAPIQVEIIQDVDGHVIITDGATLIMKVERQVIGEAVVGNISLVFEKTPDAEKLSAEEIAALTDSDFVEVDLTALVGGEDAVLYTAEEAAAEAERAAAAEEEPAFVEGDIKIPAVPGHAPISYTVDNDEISIDMSSAAEGYYRITVINRLNGDQKETLSQVICRAVKPAAIQGVEIEILTGTGNHSSVTEPSVHGNHQMKAIPSISGLHDEILFNWYKVVGVPDGMEEDEGFDILIEGATGEIYKPNDDGTYYCKVINKVEDTEAALNSNTVVFTA